ncbi:hypothetical protein IG631_22702 [Alternaria alternata]|nr:hypothetical protein IG631_22702 [Alternaria alternata]
MESRRAVSRRVLLLGITCGGRTRPRSRQVLATPTAARARRDARLWVSLMGECCRPGDQVRAEQRRQ